MPGNLDYQMSFPRLDFQLKRCHSKIKQYVCFTSFRRRLNSFHDFYESWRCVVLCCVMLCYVMLCYVMLCYVMLCYVMLCYVMLCYVMSRRGFKTHSNTQNTVISSMGTLFIPAVYIFSFYFSGRSTTVYWTITS